MNVFVCRRVSSNLTDRTTVPTAHVETDHFSVTVLAEEEPLSRDKGEFSSSQSLAKPYLSDKREAHEQPSERKSKNFFRKTDSIGRHKFKIGILHISTLALEENNINY